MNNAEKSKRFEQLQKLHASPLKNAYKLGNNWAGERAYYHCHNCDLELLGEDVGFVAAGSTYANGEFAPCPHCDKENSIDRDSLEDR